ncbi:zinc ABC transporter substrate-binding protein [Serpentinicella sp. ANB-PHB4]|uniref:metal ABC transporter solute-binding protein, Zn/Mn family n=1 Tax=Serpentinicella sp. ANB-PHB4 TaxID=3074076 RepID=UPI00285AD88B|nr:zinc ABC transporter substrate-binding protein [Serpentinicella sp. ANB-PHB4]MDR5658826.1 zinc ABC transporter substrate-binding protein [Serpentinicella sp. ANB-PHB4]
MKKLKFLSVLLIFIMFSSIFVGCTPSDPEVSGGSNTGQIDPPLIVASTSWTAAIAEAAGATDVVTLAPVELRHPPEYDFKPSDIQKVQDADWIIFGGYEPFMNKIIEANDIPQDKIIRISTTNTFDNLNEQTQLIAEYLGTDMIQEAWLNQFSIELEMIQEKAIEQNIKDTKVLVHTHMAAFAESLGYEIAAVFSADDLSPARIGELATMDHDLIIDNYHNPQGEAIQALSEQERVVLRNFPGPEHEGIADLFVDNAKKLGLY